MYVIEKQGSVVLMRNLSLDVLSPSNPTKRGNVTSFSDASRRRLIDLTARLDVTGTMPKFLTLTFSGIPEPQSAKNSYRKFVKRLRRRFESLSALWRVEMQKRGAAHFHMIIFNMPYVLQAELQSIWQECTGEELSIVFITEIKNAKMVMNYVSKYIAKRENIEGSTYLDRASYLTAPKPKWLGRHWGVINREKLPFAKREISFIRSVDTAKYFWWMVAKLRERDKPCNPLVARLYTDSAQQIFNKAVDSSRVYLLANDELPAYYEFNRRRARKRVEKFFFPRVKGIVKPAKHERSELGFDKETRGNLPLPKQSSLVLKERFAWDASRRVDYSKIFTPAVKKTTRKKYTENHHKNE